MTRLSLPDAVEQLRALLLDREHLVRAVGSGRRRGTQPQWRRVELRPVQIAAGPRLQVVTFDDRQSFTRNEEWGAGVEQAVDALLAEPFGNWHVDTVERSWQIRVTKSGDALVHDVAAAREQRTLHDRSKPRRVGAAEPFLHELGITTATGQIKPSRADKYRQVEEFVRALDPLVQQARDDGRLASDPLRVVDLGCGNAYLTFATYHALARTQRLPVQMVGVDVKEQAREHSSGVAARLGWSEHVSFVEGTITDAVVAEPVDVVVALHACDTATDDALARAVRWQASLVLAAPCCHQDLHRRLRASGRAPDAVAPALRFGILQQRLADVLTDALRACVLRLLGYRVEVVEFVDTQHTPRNVLLRAVRTGAPATAERWAEYRAGCEAWGVTPYLAELLTDELEAAAADLPARGT